MTESSTFSFERFLTLPGSEVASYTEPFVTTDVALIPNEVYSPLVSALAYLDETHLVYALEICMRLNSQDFIHRAVDYLTHADAAVCITAFRLIEYLPLNEIPTDVAEKLFTIPVVDLFGPDLHSGERICVGTNETILRSLKEHKMIVNSEVVRNGANVLVGIGMETSVLDILTSDALLKQCLKVLRGPHRGMVSATVGTFGIYPITLVINHDDTVALVIDGPEFAQRRSQCAQICLRKEEFERLVIEALQSE